jgi:hypothetical protein
VDTKDGRLPFNLDSVRQSVSTTQRAAFFTGWCATQKTTLTLEFIVQSRFQVKAGDAKNKLWRIQGLQFQVVDPRGALGHRRTASRTYPAGFGGNEHNGIRNTLESSKLATSHQIKSGKLAVLKTGTGRVIETYKEDSVYSKSFV